MACAIFHGKLGFSPVHEALKHDFLSIDDFIVVVVGDEIMVPEDRTHWPLSVVIPEHNECWWENDNQNGGILKPYVLCGLKRDIKHALSKLGISGKASPMYVVSDEPVGCTCECFCVPSLADGEWEETIATICSHHVSSIPQMVVLQAKKTPSEIAVVSSTFPISLTYSELVLQAWELGAVILRVISEHYRTPLPDNMLVGFVLPPSSLTTITMLAMGLRRIGAVVIAAKPPQVAEYQLNQVGCHALLVLDTPPQGISSTQVPCIIRLNELYDRMIQEGVGGNDLSVVVPPVGVSVLNDTSIVEWTSGSTGKPKAMAVTAWRLAHWIRWRQYHFPMSKYGKRVGVGLFWAWYWHIPLCQGGCMVVIPDEMTVDVVSMVGYLALHRVDWVDCLTPGQLKMMVELVSPQSYPHLPVRHIMSSGEALSVSVAKVFLSRFPTTTLSNVLSTTETAADICCLKNISYDLCERLEKDETIVHVPVLEDGGLVVWGNTLGSWVGEEGERLLINGWNIEPGGYATGEHSDSFINRMIDGESSPCESVGCFLTGDRIVWRDLEGRRYGCVEGRVDDVIKLRGFRIDLAGVEACLNSCVYVRDSVALSHQDTLYALVVLTGVDSSLDDVTWFLSQRLSPSSVPVLVPVPEIEYTKTGKKDRKNMVRFLPQSRESVDLVGLDLWSEKAILLAMEQQLGVAMKPSDNFFDLGGNSFKALRVCQMCEIPVALFFATPSPALLCVALKSSSTPASSEPSVSVARFDTGAMVCGIGLRLPGANTVNELWEKMKGGEVMTSVVSHSANDQVVEKGVTECHPSCGAAFDAFGDCGVAPIVPNGVSITGTTSIEQRVLLELSYEALQDAGFDPLTMEQSNIRTGVFLCGGSLPHLGGELDAMRQTDPAKYFAFEIGHDKDYLAAAVAWALDLRGPVEVVATACSSSLVAVARAVQALRLGVCDVALAGGASFTPDQAVNFQQGMIWSKTGCRPFCDDADGTVPADGAAVVCLVSESYYNANINALSHDRKLNQYCKVDGVAVNNDGRRKGGFCQPSMAGQVEVVKTALRDARVGPEEVDYVEAHGTGTRIGDPIEIEALSQVYRKRKSAKKLLVGSLKSNLGHLNTVSGIAGFIKTALCLKYRTIVPQASKKMVPPVLNRLVDWSSLPLTIATPSAIAHHGDIEGSMQRATVSAFGIGGTNACVVMSNILPVDVINQVTFQQRPVLQLVETSTSEVAASTLTRCVSHSTSYADDLAFEFELIERAKSRKVNSFKSFQVVSRDDRCSVRVSPITPTVTISRQRPVVLVFVGQGGTYQDMGEALACSGLLDCAPFDHSNWMSSEAILRVSLAIADTVTRSLPGEAVVACIGHSFGEWVAAAYSGVVDRQKALQLAKSRDQLLAGLQLVDRSGVPLMLSVRASSSTVTSLGLPSNMSVCIVNSPINIVVGGYYLEDEVSSSGHIVRSTEVSAFLSKLDDREIAWRILNTTTAFHTAAVDALVDPLCEAVKALGELSAPSLPIISSVTGTYVHSASSHQMTPDFSDPHYWATQCRAPVRFDLALETLSVDYPDACIVEIGPSTLVGIIKQHKGVGLQWDVWPTLRTKQPSVLSINEQVDNKSDELFQEECRTFLECLGNLFVNCSALPSIITSRGSAASFPPYDFTLHQPRHQPVSNPSVQISKTDKLMPQVETDYMYDICWEEIEGGISVAYAPVLPVLILEHLVGSTHEQHEQATGYLQQINLDACTDNYLVVDETNVVDVAHRHGRLAIVAGLAQSTTKVGDGQDVISLCKHMVDIIQRLSEDASDTPLDLYLLLDGSPRYAALRGLIRSARSECSHFAIRSLTIQSTCCPWYLGGGKWSEVNNTICQVLLPAIPSELFVCSPGRFFQPRLIKAPQVDGPSFDLKGVIAVVTGGLSGVGLHVAKHLLISGTASQVLLLGRTSRSSELLDEVVALGGVVVLCDVSDAKHIRNFRELIRDMPREVELVIHCAGVIADELLINVSPDHCEGVLGPKVTGTLLLRSCCLKARFVLFSSTSSTLGVVGQATYGAANAFMDEMAVQWGRSGGTCCSIQWGGWGEVGMAVDHHISPLAGEHFFRTEQGLDVLAKVISTDKISSPVCMAINVDWSLYVTNPAVAPASGNTLFQSVLSKLPDTSASCGVRSVVAPSVICYERVFGGPTPILGERPDMAHVVNGDAMLPATSYLSWVLECVSMEHSIRVTQKKGVDDHRYRLRSCRFVKPLMLSDMHLCRLVMTGLHETGGGITVSSGQELHASMKFEWPIPCASSESITSDFVQDEWHEVTDPYEAFAAQGFSYGPSFSRLQSVRVRDKGVLDGQSEAWANLSMSSSFVPSAGTLDSSLQLISLCDGGVMGVPTKIDTLDWFAPLQYGSVMKQSVGLASVRVSSKQGVRNQNLFNLSMCDSSGVDVVKMTSIELFPLFQSHSSFTFLKCKPTHKSSEGPRSSTSPKNRNLIRLDKSEDGTVCAVIYVGECTVAQLVSLVGDIRKCAKCNALRNVSIFPRVTGESKVRKDSISCQMAVRVISHSVENLGLKVYIQGRVHEHVEKEEIVLPSATNGVCSSEERFKARCDSDGVIDGVWFERVGSVKELAPHQVEIKTSCWALNFRDVLVSRGAIPMDTNGEELGIGGECGGVVVRVGSSVTRVRVGDEVVAVPPDGMGSYVVVREEFVSPPLPWKSSDQSMKDKHGLSLVAADIASSHSIESIHRSNLELTQCEQLVSQSLVYATAWLALEWQARVSSSEVVLVHSAAGGVGLAAIFLLQRKNCVIYATASTHEKRSILQKIGCHGVFDSRNVEAFTVGIQTAEVLRTGNVSLKTECVDVVLNSLTGEAVDASLALLKPFGRFVELGKRSSFEDGTLPMKPFLKGLSFSAAHVDVLMLERRSLASTLLDQVWAALPDLPLLPQAWFAMTDINSALDYMAKGVHVGKISVFTGVQVSTRNDASAVLTSAKYLKSVGPDNDPVLQSLRQYPLCIESDDSDCCVAAVPGMLCEDTLSLLTVGGKVPNIVFAEYSCVAVLAKSMGVRVVVELKPWQPIHSLGCQEIQKMLNVVYLKESIHLVAVIPAMLSQSHKPFDRDELQQWLIKTISHISGVSEIVLDVPLESYGVDSLAQITLARRIGAHVGLAAFSVGDLMRNPTVGSTLDHLQGLLSSPNLTRSSSPAPGRKETQNTSHGKRYRVLCFHGFRSSGDLLELSLNAMFKHQTGTWSDLVDFEFVTAPHKSSGPTDPDIPEGIPTFEWWCGDKSTYEDGWALLGDIGEQGKLERSRRHILSVAHRSAQPVVGIIGFSQGAAMACYMATKGDFAALDWVGCFSAVPPENINYEYQSRDQSKRLNFRSFHCFDKKEDHASLCHDVVSMFETPTVIHHNEGHAIPKQTRVADKFLDFISQK